MSAGSPTPRTPPRGRGNPFSRQCGVFIFVWTHTSTDVGHASIGATCACARHRVDDGDGHTAAGYGYLSIWPAVQNFGPLKMVPVKAENADMAHDLQHAHESDGPVWDGEMDGHLADHVAADVQTEHRAPDRVYRVHVDECAVLDDIERKKAQIRAWAIGYRFLDRAGRANVLPMLESVRPSTLHVTFVEPFSGLSMWTPAHPQPDGRATPRALNCTSLTLEAVRAEVEARGGTLPAYNRYAPWRITPTRLADELDRCTWLTRVDWPAGA